MHVSFASHRRLLTILLSANLLLGLLTLSLLSGQGAAQAAADQIITSGALTRLADLIGNNRAPIGTTNCRVGVSLGNQVADSIQYGWMTQMGIGWFINFNEVATGEPSNVEFVRMIGVFQHKDANGNYLPSYYTTRQLTEAELGADVAAHPGSVWIVGNEVDRVGQGETNPDIFAIAYYDIYHFIKQRDPTAQIAFSGLVEVTPARLQYLDIVWDTYANTFGGPMPVDIWTFHVYLLAEVEADGVTPTVGGVALGTDISLAKRLPPPGNLAACNSPDVICFLEHDSIPLFMEHVSAMRLWMKQHGYRNTPLLLTEFSILFPYQEDSPGSCWVADENNECFDPERVSAFLVSTFNYLRTATDVNTGYPYDNNRLVQQWLWYSMATTGDAGDASDLINDDGSALTEVGQTFQAQLDAQPLTVNVFPISTWGLAGPVQQPSNTATASLVVNVKNNGNTFVGDTYSVTFYRDAALSLPIGSTIITESPGCARGVATATINWSNLAPGAHQYWVKIDSLNGIPETNEADNVTTGIVVVDPVQSYMPVVLRSIQ